MNQPPIDELMKRVDNKYTLVLLTAKRARMLMEQNEKTAEKRMIKPVTEALNEIATGKLKIERT